jgi:hypothetical protein
MDEFGAIEQSIGQITSGIRRGALTLKTISFVREELPSWRDDPDRIDDQSERALNLQLSKFLDSRARNAFPMVSFSHEENEPNGRSVDLSASPFEAMVIGDRLHTIYDPFLVFECKRLPAPSRDREQEYITGGIKKKSGGIQRFKLGLHGAKLDLVVMIGYVQKRSMPDWHHQINKWISELSSGKIEDHCKWEHSEKLHKLEEEVKSGIASCQSVHNRIGPVSSSELTIHHLWVAMNLKQIKEDGVIHKARK